MGVGLINEATIDIKFVVHEEELKQIKSAFAGISKALNLQKAVQDFNALEKVVESLENQVRELTSENKRLSADMATAVEAATKKITSATNRRLKSLTDQNNRLKEQMRAEKAAAAETVRAAVAAERAAAATRKKTAETRKANAESKKAATAEAQAAVGIMDEANAYLRLVVMLTRTKAARDAYAASIEKERKAAAARIALRMDQKAKQEADALNKLNQERQEAAQKVQAQAMYERMLADIVGRGFGFYKKYGALIETIKNARNADIKTLQKYAQQLQAVITLESKRSRALNTGKFIDANGMQQSMGLLTQMTERISEAEKKVDALFRASYRLTMVGHTLRRFSQDIFRVGNDIMNTFGDFEFMLNRARGALQVWSGSMIEGHDGATLMRDGVLELANELKVFPAQEVAQAVYFWGSTTGQVVNTVEDLSTTMSGLNSIMKTAAMTNTSYESTVKGVYSILTQYFAGSLEKADDVTMQLFETTQRTAAEFTDLIQSFKMVGPVAAQAGASFEDVNATLGQLADLGIRGTMAGRGLRQFFIQMVRPSGPAQKALDKRFNELAMSMTDPFKGKSFFETTFPEGEFVGIEEHMRNLAIATNEMTQADRNRLLAQISTANMLPLVTALVEEQRLELNKLSGATKDYATDAEQAALFFERNWKLLDQSWNALRGTIDRTVDAIRINIGSVISEALRPFIESIQQVLEKFNQFVKNNPAVVAAVGKLIALLGAGAGLAGAIFVVLGALTGLGAAIALTVEAFSPWLKMIANVTSALGFLAVAIIDNFDYIKNVAVQVIDNLGSAFGNLEDDLGGIADMFEKITAPAREMVGIFVRVIADITLRVSELIETFSRMSFASDAVNVLVTALGLLVSGRIVSGILSVGAALTAMTAGPIIGGIKSLVQYVMLLGKAVATKGLVSGLRGVSSLLIGLVGGPLGLAGLAVAGGFLAYDLFPPFKDAVDGVSNALGGLDAKVGDVVTSLGDLGGDVQKAVIRFQGLRFDTGQVNSDIDKMMSERDSLMDKLNAQPPMGADKKSAKKFWRGIFGNIFQDEGDFAANLQQASADAEARVLELNDLIANSGQQFKSLEVSAKEWQARSLSSIEQTFGYLTKIGSAMGKEDLPTLDEFNQVLIELSDNLPSIDPTILARMASKMFMLPDMNMSEFEANFKRIVANNPIFEGIPMEAIRSAFKDSIGENASKVTAELERHIESLWSIHDPAALRRALLAPVEGFSKSLSQLSVTPGFEGVKDAIGALMQRQVEMGDEIPLNQIEAGLKEILDSMIHDATADIAPMFSDLALELQTLSVWGPQNYDAMAQAILGAVMPDGQKLLEAFAEGELPLGQAGLNLMEIAKNLVEQGFGGAELARIVEISAEQTGNEVGEAATQGLRKGLAEGLSADRLTMQEVIDMGKAGTNAQQIAKAIRYLGGEILNKAMRGNMQQRIAGRGSALGIVDTVMDYLTFLDKKPKKAKANRAKDNALRQLKNVLPNMPALARNALKEKLRGRVSEGLMTSKQFAKLFPKTKLDPKDLFEAKPLSGADIVAMIGGGTAEGGPGTKASEGSGAITKIGADLGTQLVNGVSAKIKDQMSVATTGTSIATLVTQSSGVSAVRVANQFGGKLSGLQWVNALGKALIDSAVYISGRMQGTVNSGSALAHQQVMSSGRSVGRAWGDGVIQGINDSKTGIDEAAKNATKSTEGRSPPKTGPLKHIDKWGYNVGAAWGKGYAKGSVIEARRAARKVRNALREEGGLGDSRFISQNKKEIRITLDVSSKDGSVDRAKTSQLRRAVMDALALADLEHMVTVG